MQQLSITNEGALYVQSPTNNQSTPTTTWLGLGVDPATILLANSLGTLFPPRRISESARSFGVGR